ncbi:MULTISPECIES: inositol monophosphatase family protein [unclassified Paraburkholderia]|uniref:inositol monophosphatase family protein n=1 Tax=unclassified Paraburkholderia TaxID=2615204 RepID=UPI00161E9011|nr:MULTISPECIES: inositol monophosphatase family protein [unclassified Paraburkholderia]MBB5445510.1 myo-inositol-1(or 4)-monophosphatase [Paraburkholderia sp. WSM4177]MBB5486010.1 myo-inositol-1(or 4)-monophosphatase [Paraburkholderia sp. WSM4180]
MCDTTMQLRYLSACAIAREAGNLMRTRFIERNGVQDLTFKGPQDYLTATDGDVERLIARRLAAAFPDDDFFGEESGGALGTNVWVVDPIDGTSEFARGVPHFCVSIAFLRDGKVEIGVLFDPMRDELFAAWRGAGATLNGQPLRVSKIDDIARASVELGWSSRVPYGRYATVHARLHALGAGVTRRGSGALGLAYVAMGRQDAYCELHINAWDAAAAILLVEEAGGWVNDFLTAECMVQGNYVIACPPALRDVLEQAMDA